MEYFTNYILGNFSFIFCLSIALIVSGCEAITPRHSNFGSAFLIVGALLFVLSTSIKCPPMIVLYLCLAIDAIFTTSLLLYNEKKHRFSDSTIDAIMEMSLCFISIIGTILWFCLF